MNFLDGDANAMIRRRNRRQVLKEMGGACAALPLTPKSHAEEPKLRIAGQDVEIQIAAITANTVRLSFLPIQNDQIVSVPTSGSLVQTSWGDPLVKLREREQTAKTVKCGEVSVKASYEPLTFAVETANGANVQQLTVDKDSGRVTFLTGNFPLLGLGEGGPQFDRRGSVDRMHSGQGGYRLQTHGGRVPVPWLIGTSGWALFFHQPFGTFDFTGPESQFQPLGPEAALPLDIFVVVAGAPARIMEEYARLTGFPEMPPWWSFGYQQSHRTLASRDEILAEAKTFREKKLPCDALIYLGTGFCPSGWNTQNGSFEWNAHVFPDPKEMIDELHRDNFRTVFHVVIRTNRLRGTVKDRCDSAKPDPEEASCHWEAHRKDFSMGVDGWWPDEGDPLDLASRLVRNRMCWEGPQLDRPNQRPYALHRNGAAGMQRYASFLWSGDVYSTWPRGSWYDFWTGKRLEGGKEISREVDLETMPLFVREGAVLPLGPVKQYVHEKSDQPLMISIYPGADGTFLLYEDDGISFNYRKGEWLGVQMEWNDAQRVFKLRLADGSRMLPPGRRVLDVKLGESTRPVVFEGQPVEVKF